VRQYLRQGGWQAMAFLEDGSVGDGVMLLLERASELDL